MAEFYPLLFGRGFSLPQLLFFAASPHPCAGPQYRPAGQATLRIAFGGGAAAAPTPASPGALRAALPLHPPAVFFSPPGSIAVRRAVNIYYQ